MIGMVIGVFNDTHLWLKEAKDLGYYIIATHPMEISDKSYYNEVKKYIDEFHRVSYFDFDKLVDVAKNGKVDAVITHPCSNDATLASGYVNTELNLRGVSYETALLAGSKDDFHKFLVKYDLPRPEFTNRYYCMEGVKFPCIVKPNYGAGSVGVKLINDLDEYIEFFKSTDPKNGYRLIKSYDYYLAQEFVDGPRIMGCHAVVHNKKLTIFATTYRNLLKEQDAQPYFYGQEFITNREPITNYTLMNIEKLVRSIGIDNTPFDLEIMLDDNNNAMSFIELNLRPAERGFNYINGRGNCEYCIREQVKLGTELDCDFSEIPGEDKYIGIKYFKFKSGKVKSITWPKLPDETLFFNTNLVDGSVIDEVWDVNTAYNNGSLGFLANSREEALNLINNFVENIGIEYYETLG